MNNDVYFEIVTLNQLVIQNTLCCSIMKTIPGFKNTFYTDELGWPVKIPYVLVNERIFLSLEESSDVLGIKAHVQARGWQKIESFIAQQGRHICASALFIRYVAIWV